MEVKVFLFLVVQDVVTLYWEKIILQLLLFEREVKLNNYMDGKLDSYYASLWNETISQNSLLVRFGGDAWKGPPSIMQRGQQMARGATLTLVC